jgi:SnoaL-like domain
MDDEQSDLGEWLHTSRITRTLDRYFRALDERQFAPSLFRRLFTDTARIVRPDGSETVGPEAIAASHAATFEHFKSTQHILTNHDVSITNEAALIRANVVAVHLWKDAPADANMSDASFSAGGVITGRLARSTDGWRIDELRNDVVWRLGSNFARLLQTVRELSKQ